MCLLESTDLINSAKELEHYDRVRRQFELTEAEKEAEKKALREENAHKNAPLASPNNVKGKGKGKAISYDSDDDAGYASLSFPPNGPDDAARPRLNLGQLGTGGIMALWKERDGDLSTTPEEEEDEYEMAVEPGLSRAAPGAPGTQNSESNPPIPHPPLPPTPEMKKAEAAKGTASGEGKSLEDLDEEYPMLPTIREEDDEKSDLSSRLKKRGPAPGQARGAPAPQHPGGFTESNDDDEELYGEAK